MYARSRRVGIKITIWVRHQYPPLPSMACAMLAAAFTCGLTPPVCIAMGCCIGGATLCGGAAGAARCGDAACCGGPLRGGPLVGGLSLPPSLIDALTSGPKS